MSDGFEAVVKIGQQYQEEVEKEEIGQQQEKKEQEDVVVNLNDNEEQQEQEKENRKDNQEEDLNVNEKSGAVDVEENVKLNDQQFEDVDSGKNTLEERDANVEDEGKILIDESIQDENSQIVIVTDFQEKQFYKNPIIGKLIMADKKSLIERKKKQNILPIWKGNDLEKRSYRSVISIT